jgi:hypothetical protein
MKEVDQLLEDAALVETVYDAQGKRHPKSRTRGRTQTPAEVALRLLILKHVRNWSYDTLEREVRANLVYRAFTRIGDEKVPDAKTLARLGQAIGPQVIGELHERLSPRAYVEKHILKPENASERFTILERRETKFRGSTAVYVHFREATEHSTSEVEESVVYRVPAGIGPSFYVVMLRTTPEFYSRDHALYLQIREGVRFVGVPAGECSND